MALTCLKGGTECGNNWVKNPIYATPAVKGLMHALLCRCRAIGAGKVVYLYIMGCMITFFQISKKIILYFYLLMLSEDPMGHTQSTNDKQSSEKTSQRVIGYLTCFKSLDASKVVGTNGFQKQLLLPIRLRTDSVVYPDWCRKTRMAWCYRHYFFSCNVRGVGTVDTTSMVFIITLWVFSLKKFAELSERACCGAADKYRKICLLTTFVLYLWKLADRDDSFRSAV